MANLIIKPTSGGSLILQDEGGTAANTIDASGNTQLAGTLGVTGASTLTGNVAMAGTANTLGTVTTGNISNTAIVYPTGHIIRSFYDQSDAALETFANNTVTEWAEMELTITGGGSASDFLQVTVNMNGIYNGAAASGVFWIGVVYSAATGGSFSGTQFGTVESVTRTGYTATTDALNIDSTIVVRAAHPSTSTYYVRPRLNAVTSAFNVNQGQGISTITAHEIKG